jgi:hypothetical protein
MNVWRLAGDTLNITCNFLYCNHQVHRDVLITLYYGARSKNQVNGVLKPRIRTRAHVELFLAKSHCWAHFPEKLIVLTTKTPWFGERSPLSTHLKTVRTYVFKNEFKRDPKAYRIVQPKALTLF